MCVCLVRLCLSVFGGTTSELVCVCVCCRFCAATACWTRPSTGWGMRRPCADWAWWITTWRAAAPWWEEYCRNDEMPFQQQTKSFLVAFKQWEVCMQAQWLSINILLIYAVEKLSTEHFYSLFQQIIGCCNLAKSFGVSILLCKVLTSQMVKQIGAMILLTITFAEYHISLLFLLNCLKLNSKLNYFYPTTTFVPFFTGILIEGVCCTETLQSAVLLSQHQCRASIIGHLVIKKKKKK